jgi:hypothetical protein
MLGPPLSTFAQARCSACRSVGGGTEKWTCRPRVCRASQPGRRRTARGGSGGRCCGRGASSSSDGPLPSDDRVPHCDRRLRDSGRSPKKPEARFRLSGAPRRKSERGDTSNRLYPSKGQAARCDDQYRRASATQRHLLRDLSRRGESCRLSPSKSRPCRVCPTFETVSSRSSDTDGRTVQRTVIVDARCRSDLGQPASFTSAKRPAPALIDMLHLPDSVVGAC